MIKVKFTFAEKGFFISASVFIILIFCFVSHSKEINIPIHHEIFLGRAVFTGKELCYINHSVNQVVKVFMDSPLALVQFKDLKTFDIYYTKNKVHLLCSNEKDLFILNQDFNRNKPDTTIISNQFQFVHPPKFLNEKLIYFNENDTFKFYNTKDSKLSKFQIGKINLNSSRISKLNSQFYWGIFDSEITNNWTLLVFSEDSIIKREAFYYNLESRNSLMPTVFILSDSIGYVSSEINKITKIYRFKYPNYKKLKLIKKIKSPGYLIDAKKDHLIIRGYNSYKIIKLR